MNLWEFLDQASFGQWVGILILAAMGVQLVTVLAMALVSLMRALRGRDGGEDAP